MRPRMYVEGLKPGDRTSILNELTKAKKGSYNMRYIKRYRNKYLSNIGF